MQMQSQETNAQQLDPRKIAEDLKAVAARIERYAQLKDGYYEFFHWDPATAPEGKTFEQKVEECRKNVNSQLLRLCQSDDERLLLLVPQAKKLRDAYLAYAGEAVAYHQKQPTPAAIVNPSQAKLPGLGPNELLDANTFWKTHGAKDVNDPSSRLDIRQEITKLRGIQDPLESFGFKDLKKLEEKEIENSNSPGAAIKRLNDSLMEAVHRVHAKMYAVLETELRQIGSSEWYKIKNDVENGHGTPEDAAKWAKMSPIYTDFEWVQKQFGIIKHGPAVAQLVSEGETIDERRTLYQRRFSYEQKIAQQYGEIVGRAASWLRDEKKVKALAWAIGTVSLVVPATLGFLVKSSPGWAAFAAGRLVDAATPALAGISLGLAASFGVTYWAKKRCLRSVRIVINGYYSSLKHSVEDAEIFRYLIRAIGAQTADRIEGAYQKRYKRHMAHLSPDLRSNEKFFLSILDDIDLLHAPDKETEAARTEAGKYKTKNAKTILYAQSNRLSKDGNPINVNQFEEICRTKLDTLDNKDRDKALEALNRIKKGAERSDRSAIQTGAKDIANLFSSCKEGNPDYMPWNKVVSEAAKARGQYVNDLERKIEDKLRRIPELHVTNMAPQDMEARTDVGLKERFIAKAYKSATFLLNQWGNLTLEQRTAQHRNLIMETGEIDTRENDQEIAYTPHNLPLADQVFALQYRRFRQILYAAQIAVPTGIVAMGGYALWDVIQFSIGQFLR